MAIADWLATFRALEVLPFERFHSPRICYPLIMKTILNDSFWFTISSSTQVEDLEVSLVRSLYQQRDPMHSCDLSTDGRYLAIRTHSRVSVFNLDTGASDSSHHSPIQTPPHMRLPIGFLPNSHALVTSGHHGGIYLFDDCESGQLHLHIFGHHMGGMVTLIAVAPDRDIMASASTDNTVCIWDTSARSRLATLDLGGILDIALSPDGCWMTLGRSEGVSLWTIRDPLRPLELSNAYVARHRKATSMFSSTGSIILSWPNHDNPQNNKGYFALRNAGEVTESNVSRVCATLNGQHFVAGFRGRLEFRNTTTGDLDFAAFGPDTGVFECSNGLRVKLIVRYPYLFALYKCLCCHHRR